MRLPSLSSKQIIRAIRKAGFTEVPHRGKGSHRAFVKKESAGKIRLTIVPHGKESLAELCSQSWIKPAFLVKNF